MVTLKIEDAIPLVKQRPIVLEVLMAIAYSHGSANLSYLVALLSRPRREIERCLKTLEKMGFLKLHDHDGIQYYNLRGADIFWRLYSHAELRPLIERTLAKLIHDSAMLIGNFKACLVRMIADKFTPVNSCKTLRPIRSLDLLMRFGPQKIGFRVDIFGPLTGAKMTSSLLRHVSCLKESGRVDRLVCVLLYSWNSSPGEIQETKRALKGLESGEFKLIVLARKLDCGDISEKVFIKALGENIIRTLQKSTEKFR